MDLPVQLRYYETEMDITADGVLLGTLIIELDRRPTRNAAENFKTLCTGEIGYSYKGSRFTFIRPGIEFKAGELNNPDIPVVRNLQHEITGHQHNRNDVTFEFKGDDSDGMRFVICSTRTGWMDNKNCRFGQVLCGGDVLDKMEKYGSPDGTVTGDVYISRYNNGQFLGFFTMCSSTGGVPYLGSKISLISKADIRYEGILYTIDPNECTVALAKVQSFGTEDRATERPVPQREEVYEYIIFRGGDIKDLNVCEPPKAQMTLAHLQDPAIVKQSGPVSGSSNSSANAFSKTSAPIVPALNTAFNNALNALPTSIHSSKTSLATQNFITAKLAEAAAASRKASVPPPLQVSGLKSPGSKSPSPKSPTKAKRSPNNKRRGSGRVIPPSTPKEGLLAEMAAMAALPAEQTGDTLTAETDKIVPPTVSQSAEGSPPKGSRRRRFVRSERNAAIPRSSVSGTPILGVPDTSVLPTGTSTPVATAPPIVAAPSVEMASDSKPQRSPRRQKSSKRSQRTSRHSVSKDPPVEKVAPVLEPPVPDPAPQPPVTTPSGNVRGRNVRGLSKQRSRGQPTNTRGSRQSNAKNLFNGGFNQANYFQGFQAGFNQALQQAYFNASVGLFGSPMQQRGGYNRGRGRGRVLSRGTGYVTRGGVQSSGQNYNANYGTGGTRRGVYSSGGYIGTGRPVFDPCAFVGDYDFEEANSKFDKGKIQEEVHFVQEFVDQEKNISLDKSNEATVKDAITKLSSKDAASEISQDYPVIFNQNGEIYYDKSKSFYDKISCTSLEQIQHPQQIVQSQAGNRVTWREARALNSETFGVPSVAAARRFVQGGVPPAHAQNIYRISPSPRGRGSRSFFRGSRGWSPRVRGSWGRGRGYMGTSYYAGHMNDYHGTDPNRHLTAALAAAAAALPQKSAPAFPTSPLMQSAVKLAVSNVDGPLTPVSQSRLVLQPTPSNTPVAVAPSASVSEALSNEPVVIMSDDDPVVDPGPVQCVRDEVLKDHGETVATPTD